MKVIKPVTITEAMLISSTAPETDYAAYAPATNYTVGQRVIYQHKVYECVQSPNTGNTPDITPLFWTAISPTNRWLMFDQEVSTQTELAGTLTVVVAPGLVSSLALLEVDGTSVTITITDGPSGPVIYSYTDALEDSIIADWYQYFYEPFDPQRTLILTDLPAFGSSYITVSITGVLVRCGGLIFGTAYYLGETQVGASSGITDYSRKETSASGATSFSVRKFSKRMSARLWLDNSQINKAQRVLAELRATPCVWIGTEDVIYDNLTIFGFFRDFSIDIAYPSVSYCNLEVEGLT